MAFEFPAILIGHKTIIYLVNARNRPGAQRIMLVNGFHDNVSV